MILDDFDAGMRYVTEFRYTSAPRLAIMGGSNGGLTMGAALTQHPQSMRAVVSQVGFYDMLRVETEPNGEFNTTEFGSTRDPAQFRALYEYSPLLRIKDGVAYPLDWLHIVFNPSFPYRFAHMFTAAFLTTSLVVLSVGARYLVAGRFVEESKSMIRMGLGMVAILALVAVIVLRPNGLIAIDNVLWDGNVVKADATDDNTVAIRAFNDKVAADDRVEAVPAKLIAGGMSAIFPV